MRGIPAEAIHGDLDQKAREAVLSRFRSNQLKVLVATDVAARGLDIEDISHVFNYHLPDDAEVYVGEEGRGDQHAVEHVVQEWGYPGFPVLSGARMSTPILGFGTSAPADPMPVTAGYGMQFWNQWAKYFIARDPQISPFAIDPAAPGEWQRRISELTALQDVNDADLRPFARSGGRLILVHGAADELVSHRSTIDYYQRVQRVMGKRATEEFSRFYLVPGANHANFAPVAFSASYDSLTALQKWAEDGVAPDRHQVVADGNVGANRTRPLCEWPTWPAYVGGSVSEASSFRCGM